MLPFSTFVIDLLVGAILVTAMSTLLERTVLTHVMEDPVRSHMLSLFAAWVAVSATIMIINPWRSEVPLVYGIAAIPIALWRIGQGRSERERIGHHRAEPIEREPEPQSYRPREDADEDEEDERGRERDSSAIF